MVPPSGTGLGLAWRRRAFLRIDRKKRMDIQGSKTVSLSQLEARSVGGNMTTAIEPRPELDHDRYWEAVAARDASFDGAFVFAVRSTGVYCRPSCRSRTPLRRNVVFFSAPEAAEQAGFRSCRKCKPAQATAEPRTEIVRRVCRILESNPDSSHTLEALGHEVGLSPFHLQRLFKRIVGISPQQYRDACRNRTFRSEVRKRDRSVSTATYEAGYGSSSRLYERAAAELGMTPSTYKRAGSGAHIRYTIVSSPLGRLLVARTPVGICAVSLGDSDAQLEAGLKREYSAATIERGGSELDEAVTALLEHLRGERPDLDLPLDVQATAFQRRVWDELRKIPYGDTRSYSEVAQAIGRPSAARAVARACASNRVALVVPCHRVVRGDNTIGGYRWGLDRKRRLLASEKSAHEKLGKL